MSRVVLFRHGPSFEIFLLNIILKTGTRNTNTTTYYVNKYLVSVNFISDNRNYITWLTQSQ